MKLIMIIAWRNILRHKGKSLVIGVILFLGALLMTIGNGIIAGMDYGIRRNIVNGFMGDITIIPDKQKSDNVMFEVMGRSIELIANYKAIKQVLAAQPFVDRFLPVGKNMGMTLSDEDSFPAGAFLLGVDFAEYRKMFPDSLVTLEGRLLSPGERGILVPTGGRDEFYERTSRWIVSEEGGLVRDHLSKEARKDAYDLALTSDVVLMGMNEANSSTDIRFHVKGIVKYHALDKILGHFWIVDIESYRECLGYFSASAKAVEVPKEEQKLLNMETGDLDSLFGSESLVVDNTRKTPKARSTAAAAATTPPADIEAGAYNLVFVRLKEGAAPQAALAALNRALSDAKLGVRATTWKKAMGPVGSMTTIIKGALFVFVTMLFVVAIIIIINTLVMSALERTSELGMMRAIGAKKGFIGGMFLGETGLLSAVFGGAGIVVGVLIVNIIPLLKITTSNDMVQLLYGGDTFRPLLQMSDILLTVVQLIIVTVIAALYPVRVARGITPLDAISRD